MEWLLWVASLLVAVVVGFILHSLGGPKAAPPTVSVFTEQNFDEKKREEKALTFFEHSDEKDEQELGDDDDQEPEELVIVAFRLPVKVEKVGETWKVKWDDPFARNVFADLRVLRSDNLIVKWVGTVPGPDIPKNDQFDLEEELEMHNCFPVFLPSEMRTRFYKGFCKGTLWPLFHYVMPQAVRLDTDFGTRWDEVWQAYRAGNMFFSKTVTRVNENNDNMIWIHGYHLLLVPSLVRRRLPKARIGLFVHEPWPSSEVFRSLPARENLLRGMLACDLIGFQTYDYVRHFLSCVKRLMNLDFKSLAGGSIGITYAGRSVAIRINHVGTRSPFFQKFALSKEVEKEMKSIQASVTGSGKTKILIVSVDYMDLTKGPQMKLQAFHRYLQSNPEKKETLKFIQVILPSSNADKNDVKALCMKEVKRICDQFGQDIIQVVDDPSLAKLVAYYRLSKVAIIATFWDGLNLIPYEYTASQSMESPGSLVISEFMGCSRSLSGVLRVNPWSIEDTANAIKKAVDSSPAKRQSDFARRYRYVMAHTLELWAKGFLNDLKRASEYNSHLRFVQVGFSSDVRLVGLRSDFAPVDMERIRPIFEESQCRLILLDYDGTLIGENKTGATPPEQLKNTLRRLCQDKKNIVFIMSGRTRRKLFRWFGDIEDLGLAAEKGCFVRWPAHILPYIESLPKSTLHARERRTITLNRGQRRYSPWTLSDEPVPEPPQLIQRTASGNSVRSLSDGETKKVMGTQQFASPLLPPPLQGRTGGDIKDDGIKNRQWYSMCDPEEKRWKPLAMPVIRGYDERTDGAMVEDKEFGIVWKFEGADPDYGQMQAREMQKYLQELIADGVIDIVVYDDNRILEILPKGVNKGLTTSLLIDTLKSHMQEPVFLMAVGDDISDEKMFSALQNSPVLNKEDDKYDVITCCVGLKPSNAQYYAHDPEEVRESLRELAMATVRMNSPRAADERADGTGGGSEASSGFGLRSRLGGGNLSSLSGSLKSGKKGGLGRQPGLSGGKGGLRRSGGEFKGF
mmetsp:Transcript_1525/g.2116  ORF Transcript_1525/g.2116 Transcript_1525/m.2116 type:complete len:1022 (-) Transcript_1525:322-3387(-)|eukprot:CAMPEP_0184490554 /NCGR_PEP_ID=MMETSP0113_2-20130426/18131_1 /TAXON_ID=91329 /ORGANISM="Norrisiella sphaerica, Strain BC52" /LENGTH=1021 /DNA_ID=CAMNT_0026874481 /DNA_START=54 /DNA_END=3119 /DNA_ORIENTATION=+